MFELKNRSIFLLVLVIFFYGNISYANEIQLGKQSQKLAVLVIIDRINIEEINEEHKHLKLLMEKGAAGLMNIRTAGSYNPASGYLTFGSGVRSSYIGKAEKIFAYDENYEGEQAGKIYENIAGLKPSPESILVLDLPSILAENKRQDHKVIPGLLGERLKKNNIKVTILGSGDTSNKKDRSTALAAMDQAGIIPQGEVGLSMLTKDLESPYLVKTNYDRLLELFNRVKKSGGLTIIQLGDTIRADEYSSYVLPWRADYFKKKALIDADIFIGKLLNQIDLEHSLLMVATPFPSKSGYNSRNLLTPFFIAGKDIEQGITYSPTTRKSGILTNLDIAPTILSFFQVEIPASMLGQPISGRKDVDVFPKLLMMNRIIHDTYVQRAYIIKPFVALQIIISFSYLFLFFRKNEWLKFMKPFILASMTIPLVLLILSIFTTHAANTLVAKYLWLVVLTLILTILLLKFNSTLRAVAAISLITAMAILFDLLSGANLMQVSPLGYDPIGGSRYYGLGNEYMGVLIGSIIVGCSALMDSIKAGSRFTLMVCSPLFVICFYLIFSPKYGSNVGGTISAFGAFAITLLLAGGIKIGLRHLLGLGIGLVISIFVLFLFISQYAPPSHISKTVELVEEGGFSALVAIFARKLAMNYKLLRYTVWTRALLASILVIAALLYRPPFFLRRLFYKYKYLYCGFIGTGAGCLLALVFNDSGIVAAATMMVFIALPILLIVIDEV